MTIINTISLESSKKINFNVQNFAINAITSIIPMMWPVWPGMIWRLALNGWRVKDKY